MLIQRPLLLNVRLQGEKMLNGKTEVFKLQFSPCLLMVQVEKKKADDLESLEQNYTSTGKHISVIVIYLV